MKHITVKTIVAIITFIVGVTFAVFWFELPSRIQTFSNVPTVSKEAEDYAVYSVVLNEFFAQPKQLMNCRLL
ncbi:MAG: hypothetical protein KIS76_17580 [Pyrinomonadaceae bacterium]|nr:hypothetical protein [Pyrinomonadaceae bacterium]